MNTKQLELVLVRRCVSAGMKFTRFWSPEDTELFTMMARKAIRESPTALVLDVGTGSGMPLICALGPRNVGMGVDVDPEALSVAVSNLERLSRRKACFAEVDFERVGGNFDIVISNPPYIPTSARELDVRLEARECGTAMIGRILSRFATTAKHFVIHFASICDVALVLKIARRFELAPRRIALCISCFGSYTTARLCHLQRYRKRGRIHYYHPPGTPPRVARQLLLTVHFCRDASGAKDPSAAHELVTLLNDFSRCGPGAVARFAPRECEYEGFAFNGDSFLAQ